MLLDSVICKRPDYRQVRETPQSVNRTPDVSFYVIEKNVKLGMNRLCSQKSEVKFFSAPVINALSNSRIFLLFAKSISKNSPKFTAPPPSSHRLHPPPRGPDTPEPAKARSRPPGQPDRCDRVSVRGIRGCVGRRRRALGCTPR